MPMPKTRKALLAAGYRFSSNALCKGCEAHIEWWTTPAGNNMPMSAHLVEGCEELISHFVDCKNREQFRRAEQAHKARVEKPRPKTGSLFE
jgi:hypothetical protein